ncbi:MAG: transcriptional regulator, TetR family [Aeromicrobium sp.]|nr:transcriptional regulator, TetR family [Aeromicrobium sp.]
MAVDTHSGIDGPVDDDGALGSRAIRTRTAILEASQRLFLERGYAGTRINNITDACGISRAGFYTYFKDKHEVVVVLGHTVYEEVLAVIGRWDTIPRPCSIDDVTAWVREYFAFMDTHGAFIFSANQSAPMDEDFRTSSRRMQMRVAFLLGVSLRGRQVEPTEAPEALGLTTLAMLDLSWSYARVQQLPVDLDDIIRTASTTIVHNLNGRSQA